MTYFSSKQPKHSHRYFLDANTQDMICLCGKVQGEKKGTEKGTNKYKAKRSNYGGYVYDSKREADYAAELDLLKKAGQILDWDKQFPVRVEPEGIHFFTTKVDFRLHMPDGAYELHEVKSWITMRLGDYRLRKKALELYWLPKHPEYSYHIIT